ncbi:MAG: protein translocase subunit SecF [Deltaproteobacteria bacterium]
MPNFVKISKYCIAFSIIITIVGFISFFTRGVVMDIDFKGGSIIEINIGRAFDNNKIAAIVKKTTGKEATIQKLGSNQDRVSIKTEPLTQEQSTAVFNNVKKEFNLKENQPLSNRLVQPLMSKEIWQRGLWSIIISSVLILIYVAIRFRIMSGFAAGVTAVLSIVHDAFIMFTVYSLLQIPINSSFVAAVLTILGYSINDTIIVYDRIRENQNILRKATRTELVNTSIMQTLNRTINTVITVLICVVTLYVFGNIYGVQSIKEFTLPLIIGLVSGVYSSIFISSPIWVWWKDAGDRKEVSKVKSSKVKPA